MHPALSVVFFTTASGAGYGIWIWLGLLALANHPLPRTASLLVLALGFVLVSTGLLGSLLHLGKPLRAWRAFSQWRSSWLSREGIASVACFLPALWLGFELLRGGGAAGFAGVVLALLSLTSVACTAMIYASLKPVPAWRHPLVLPLYLLFSLFTGGLLVSAMLALAGGAVGNLAGFAVMATAVLLWRMKRVAWRSIDVGALPVTRNAALGLPDDRTVRVFERPHTEANYLLKEMGFVLARKHSRRLRIIALLLFAAVPAVCGLPVWFVAHLDPGPWLAVAAASALAGTFIERWLFFAEARHLVTLYY